MVSNEGLKELQSMKRANELTIAGIKKEDNNSFNEGYIAALKFQNKMIKLRIKAA